ncbi:type II toxin-antitoxin system RelE/ParE family toxin [Chlorobium sp. KB01]|uniref:type II toxin-antitoxin system RelE/ParE family toxin n=1 Tax=Chlorobium sp. KB01 TaxID=1917528 RepID=UPI000975974E|nr:type II toxin-antitoxin system RelE/ParE family toxin [Chlorobium sp. KB01]
MRVFKYKWFHRWAEEEKLSDNLLSEVARQIINGQVEADLGGYLFKKRIPRQGRGKSSGYRVIVGYKRPDDSRIVFLYAFPKNSRSNITLREKSALQLVAKSFILATDDQINKLLANKEYREITDE